MFPFHYIQNYIRRFGEPYALWYCGVAADPYQRLFADHNVNFAFGPWVYCYCWTDSLARLVERIFLGLGCKGGPGGGDRSTRFVYVYRITPTTVE